jgi:hypothetical protein
LSDIPCDPKDDFISYIYVTENAECPSWFQLYTNLEDEDDVIIEKVGCTYGCGPDCQFNYGVASPNQNLNPYCGPEAPPVDPAEYVCDPAGSCEVYSDPEISGCPDIYPDDPTCQDQCEPRINRCHDERGKFLH